jgi:ABC-2 type transport system ATP-binding protein
MLSVQHLTKRYSGIAAVQDVTFQVRPFEVLGYLGPNGSGKTTTVNMLTGLLEPTQGQILFQGRNITEDLIEYKRRLGYVPEIPYIYPYLSGLEYLQLCGRLRSMPEHRMNEKIHALLEAFGLHASRHSILSSYSKGMKQKVLISGAILHDPDILIFDEPLSGLDVTSALVFRHLVKALSQEGKIVLYCSHVLEVVEKVCTHVMILRKGQVVAHDSVERLRTLANLPSLEDVFAQLVLQEDTEQVARGLVQIMKA